MKQSATINKCSIRFNYKTLTSEIAVTFSLFLSLSLSIFIFASIDYQYWNGYIGLFARKIVSFSY